MFVRPIHHTGIDKHTQAHGLIVRQPREREKQFCVGQKALVAADGQRRIGAEDVGDAVAIGVDAGMVYGPNENVDLGVLRYSAGFAFNWFSPIGPLSISYAFPLNDRPGDKTEAVQFTLGQAFR